MIRTRWFLLLSLLGPLAAGPVAAGVYYASPNGSASNSGTTASAPWSLSKANSSLVAGDVCYLLPGSYSGDIRPSNSGTSNASRITYVGSVASPSDIVLSGTVNLSDRRFVTVKGVEAAHIWMNAVSGRAQDDSVLYSVSRGDFIMNGALRCHLADSRIGDASGGDRWEMWPGGGFVTESCSVLRNVFRVGDRSGQPHVVTFRSVKQGDIGHNNVYIYMPPSAGDVHGRIQYGVNNTHFHDNKWVCNNQASGSIYMLVNRDYTQFNLTERDTLLEDPASVGVVRVQFSGSGSNPYTTASNTYVDCIYATRFTHYQNTSNDDVFHGCQFIGVRGARALEINSTDGSINNLTLRHCTFYSAGGMTVNLMAVTGLRVVSCLFYTNTPNCPGTSISSSATVDSCLFFERGGSSSQALGRGSGCSSPGGTNRWGDPLFAETSESAIMTALLTAGAPPLSLSPGSCGLNGGPCGDWVDGYVGALADPSAPDVTPPGTVTTLATMLVSDVNLALVWTAPGDDGFFGTASGYDLRWSNQPITDQNFTSATQVLPAPTPFAAGAQQTHVIGGLTPGATYYVALRAVDNAGNWSATSNVLSVTMALTDQIPPDDSGYNLSATP